MTERNLLGVDMPGEFPFEAYNSVKVILNKYGESYKTQVTCFRQGWNGVARRYLSMAQYDNEFTDSIGRLQTHKERHIQDKTIFGFFVNGVSVVDCFFYGVYWIASILKPDEFSGNEAKKLNYIYPESVKNKFKNDNEFKEELLTRNMEKYICENSFYSNMKDMRDVLSHRGIFRYNFYLGGGEDKVTIAKNPKDLPEKWQNDLLIDINTTRMYHEQLSYMVKELVEANAEFCKRKL